MALSCLGCLQQPWLASFVVVHYASIFTTTNLLTANELSYCPTVKLSHRFTVKHSSLPIVLRSYLHALSASFSGSSRGQSPDFSITEKTQAGKTPKRISLST